MHQLNHRARVLCQRLIGEAESIGVTVSRADCGTTIIDCGVAAPSGTDAGLRLAEICLAGLGAVDVAPPRINEHPSIAVATADPVAACLASQYAGWEIKGEDFFAMGSGPMRAAAGNEDVFAAIGHRESPYHCVGVLESGKLPPDDTCQMIAVTCGIEAERLTLLVAPTRSPAGTLQIVARSVETALHKLHELRFDLSRLESGRGQAPLPPAADNDLAAIGLTNDAILYGGEVVLELHGDDESLKQIGPQVPSCASHDHGRPFAEIFARYDHDFYAVDPHLFSPAVITLQNIDTGNTFRYGELAPAVLAESFGSVRGSG